MTSVAYHLRPITPTDDEFLFRLHAASMGDCIVDVFGPWNEAVQRQFHRRWFERALADAAVIVVDDEDVGVLQVASDGKDLYLGRIELLPHRQGRGIGSAVVADVVANADARDKAVSLHLFDVNRARRLYERLGFKVVGEDGRRLHMRRPLPGR